MAEADALSHLLAVYLCENSSADLKNKCKVALKNILVMCTVLDALEPLIERADDAILFHVLT